MRHLFGIKQSKKLTVAQESEIQKIIIDKRPEQLRLKGFLWDRKNISDLIKTKYGIDIPLSTMWRYLANWGFTAQRLTVKNRKQNPEAVKKWLNEEYPAVEEQAKVEKAEIFWGDETGVQNETNYVKGYAPKGKTPVLPTEPDKSVRVNMISAVSNSGKLEFMFYSDKMCQECFKEFMERLIKNSAKKPFLIVDNLPVHHGNELKEWLAINQDRIRLFFLPSYSPERNPDEYLNGNPKREIAKKPYAKTREQIRQNANEIMERFKNDEPHVARFFQHPNVKYAA